MSQSQTTDHNATPLDDDSGLRGGTQGGTLVPPVVNDRPSTPTAATPVGGGANEAAVTAPRRASTDGIDPTDAVSQIAGDGTRHPSAAEAAREARSAVRTDTASGFNAGDKANERREDTSDGTHASTSGRKLAEPGEVARADG